MWMVMDLLLVTEIVMTMILQFGLAKCVTMETLQRVVMRFKQIVLVWVIFPLKEMNHGLHLQLILLPVVSAFQ